MPQVFHVFLPSGKACCSSMRGIGGSFSRKDRVQPRFESGREQMHNCSVKARVCQCASRMILDTGAIYACRVVLQLLQHLETNSRCWNICVAHLQKHHRCRCVIHSGSLCSVGGSPARLLIEDRTLHCQHSLDYRYGLFSNDVEAPKCAYLSYIHGLFGLHLWTNIHQHHA